MGSNNSSKNSTKFTYFRRRSRRKQYRALCSHLDYVSHDFAQYDGKGDGVGGQTGRWDYGKLDIISDVTSIPEPNNSFDAIMCTEVFEHIPEPIKD